MNTRKATWWGLALLAVIGLSGRAHAALEAQLNIQVTFNNAKSVTVDGSGSSTHTVAWTTPNEYLTDASSATVTNNALVAEGLKLYTNAASLAPSGNTWSRVSSTSSVGTDEFAVQAVFGSSKTVSCAGLSGATWDSNSAPALGAGIGAATTWTSGGMLASTELASDGISTPDTGNVIHGGHKRALCFRVATPFSTTADQSQTIQVIVAAY